MTESMSTHSIDELHREVDRRAAEVARLNEGRLQCRRGCSGCCVDDLTVFEVEATILRARHAELLAFGAPHPEGACAFLDAGGSCRIYPDRPYVCRTQGLPLRWLDEDRSAECRDVCELNDAPIEGEWPTILELPEEACFTLGEPETRLQALQRALSVDDPLGRVRLRDLFERPVGSPRLTDEPTDPTTSSTAKACSKANVIR